MAGSKRIFFLGFCVAALGLTVLLGLTAENQALAAQKGDVVIATSSRTFNQTGGDIATLTGAPPYTSRSVFESVVGVTKDREVVPAIAKSWKIAADWKYVDFFLRDDIKFQDGTPVTVEDVKYSIEVYMRKDLKYVFGAMWRRIIKDLEILSPTQLRVHLAKADWGFVPRLWWAGGIMPKAYREKVGDKGFAENPIGAGPFKWAGYKQDQWMKFEAVENHWRKTPSIKSVKIVFVPENSTRLAMLKAGEADIASLMGAHVPQVKSDPNLRVHWVKYTSGTVLVFADLIAPNEKSPFLDIRVRKAASLAINREIICEKVLFGAAEPSGDVLPPVTLGHDNTIKPEPYDPERAKTLLKEAGYPKGFDTAFHTTSASNSVQAIIANLQEVGIRAKLNVMEAGAYYGNFFPRKFRGLLSHVGWYDVERAPVAELSDFYLQGMPHTYITTPEIHKAMSDGAYSVNDEELAEWGRKISKLVRESYIKPLLWANHTAYGLGPRIKSWVPTTGGVPAIEFETIVLK
ncbi:MAG: ABC transporter substrate-binding protein [Deltaproteobacteria bacterium]|nr:ABC transporter substrate-binding protein [Deltaproteobacteria bacterium]